MGGGYCGVCIGVVMVVVVMMVVAVATADIEFMLLSGWVSHVHNVQILLMMVLLRRLGHVRVDRGHNLGRRGHDGAHHRVVRRLLLMGRGVCWWASGSRRRLRTRVVLLVGLARRGSS